MKELYKHRLYFGMIGEIKNLEQDYSEMAERGWMIDKIGFLTHRYRAIEPRKRHFFVDILPQITAFDYPENEDARDYRQICEESGWMLAAANKQLHVFYSDAENGEPIPIHTDNAIQAKIYLNACKKSELPVFLLMPFMFMLLLYMHIYRGAEFFLSNLSLFTIIGIFCFLPVIIWQIGFVIRWYHRTKKSAKHGLPMPAVNRRLSVVRKRVFLAGGAAYLASMVAGVILEVVGGLSAFYYLSIMFLPLLGIAAGLWLRRQIDTKRRSRAGNIWLAVVTLIIMEIMILGGMVFISSRIITSSMPIYSDSIGDRPVLTLEDIGVTAKANDIYTVVRSSIAVPVNYQYLEHNTEGGVHTQVWRSISKSLTNRLYDHYAEQYKKNHLEYPAVFEERTVLTPEEAAFWGAERGMVCYYPSGNSISLILLNGKTILQLGAEGADMDIDTLSQAVQRLWGE